MAEANKNICLADMVISSYNSHMRMQPLDRVMGIRHWARWSPGTPKYEVLRVMGYLIQQRRYLFYVVRSRTYISLAFSELNTHTVRPFLIDTKLIINLTEKLLATSP